MRMERPFEKEESKTKSINQLVSYSRCTVLLLLLLLSARLAAQLPVPNFTGTPITGCSPLSVQFTDQSSGNPSFWNWDLGNGQLSTLQNPTAFYNTPGSYTITLVVRNAAGINSITKTNYIVVSPSPSPDFSANLTTVCLPATIQFTDLTVPNAGTITQWRWDFGDGNTSTQANPSHQYTATGFYTVSLRVTSSTGCESVVAKGNFIRILSGVTPDFSFTPLSSCNPPFVTNFTDLTSGPGTLTYQWDLGNSTTSTQQNPSTSYSAPGTYTVKLDVVSQYGCSGTVQKNIVIPSSATSFSNPDTVCIGSVVNFQNTSLPLPVSSIWNFGNGKQSLKINDTSSYNAPGTYQVKLVNTYASCKDSLTKNIVVKPNPTVDFTAPAAAACRAPFTVNFQDISPNAVNWLWNFGDGGTSTQQNPSHQYNAAGQFNVSLTITDNKGCRNTITKSSFVRIIPPQVNIGNAPAGGCVPFTYSPTASVNAIDGIASYFWDFGDGFTSTSPTPSHTYASTGNYTLKLVITTTGGCRDSIVINNGVKVGTPTVANFSAAPLGGCASDTISFTDLSAVPVDAWRWDFGDGSTSTLQNPKHIYSDTGYFSITLIAYNNGCGQSVTQNQYIHILPPIAHYSYAINCTNKRQVVFSNDSKTDAAYGPITYLWEFGDLGNSTSNLANPSFVYPSLGSYTVKLTVTNGTCTSVFTQNVTLNNEIADFTISKTTICKYELIVFDAIVNNVANITRFDWSFDGSPYITYGPSVTNYFTTNGPHTISLAITDINGCTDTIVKNSVVTVAGPIANFAPATIGNCRNKLITFNDLSTSNAPLVEWTFDFGDGSQQTFTTPPFTHSYADSGMYVVTLTAKDANGCTDTFALPTRILITRPITKFASSSILVCPGTSVQFSDSSLGYGLSYAWSFGDGGSSTVKNPVHIYNGTDSVYSVKLVITDTVGCTDSLTKINYITTKVPKPAFDIKDTSSICPPLETKFTFRGQDYESFYWDFGDGGISTLLNPTHFYNSYGSFTPKLFLVGYGGCIDSISAQVNVYNPVTNSSLIYGPLTACNSLLVDFSITTPPSTRFTFYAGDSFIDSSQSKSFQHLYSSFGFFNPIIIIQDSSKCKVGFGSNNTIRILGAEPLFGMDKKAFCDTGTVLFANFTIGNDPVVSTVWNFGDGNTSTIDGPSHRYTVPGTYYPSLTVNTQAGCTKTLNDTVRVYATPVPSIGGDSVVCINEQLLLQGLLAVSDTSITWKWNFGNGSSASVQNPNTRYGSAGNYMVTLEAANKLGCKNDTSKNIMVPPAPIINVLNNPIIAVGTSITLPLTYGPNISTYNWVPPLNLSCADCSTPVASPKSTTKYTVTATDIYGCTNSNEITVIVVCNDKNYFVPNTFSPNNDGNNDRFYPRGAGIARIQSMKIFNRWGEIVFERRNFSANDATLGWDGTYKGKKAETDTYIYMIEFVCENSVIFPYTGNVTLIR